MTVNRNAVRIPSFGGANETGILTVRDDAVVNASFGKAGKVGKVQSDIAFFAHECERGVPRIGSCRGSLCLANRTSSPVQICLKFSDCRIIHRRNMLNALFWRAFSLFVNNLMNAPREFHHAIVCRWTWSCFRKKTACSEVWWQSFQCTHQGRGSG